jgi:hypothetical protein
MMMQLGWCSDHDAGDAQRTFNEVMQASEAAD